MIVIYKDDAGIVSIEIDFYNIQFLDGECYFSSNGEEYRIKTEQLITIERI